MSLLRFLPLAAALAASGVLHAKPLTLQPGERMSFRVSWGLFNAGEIEITADAIEGTGEPRTEVVVSTASVGLVRALYSFDGEARSIFDPSDGKLLFASATTHSKKKQTQASITLDHDAAQADYVDHLNAGRCTTVPLPAHRPMDLVTSLIEARAWSLQPGDTRPVAVLFDDKFYELTLHAEGYEKIKTAAGKREALLIVPRMDENPRGIFKRGGEIRVWLDREPPHLPLRFEVKTKVGTAVALLTDYRAPGVDGDSLLPAADSVVTGNLPRRGR